MKKIIISSLVLILAIITFLLYKSYEDTKDPYVVACDYTVPESNIPTFTEATINFKHIFNDQTDLPVMASCIIDIDNDGVDEIFVGGGTNQKDGLFKYSKNGFIDISTTLKNQSTEKSSTLGVASFDLDEDGDTDLLLARTEGVFFLRNDDGVFTAIRLDITPNEKSNPISFTLGDYDMDGDADIFLCTYLKVEKMEGQTIFNRLDYGATSMLLRNDGDLKFTDVTEAMNLKFVHNTFQAVMVDFDSDGWLDIAVAYDTGVPTIYKNLNGKKFVSVKTPLSGKYSYPMGIAVGDYNNDSKIDLFFSNTGSTVPEFMVKGDLTDQQELVTDWLLFENQGNMDFKDEAKNTKIADFEFSWGAVFEDFNLDGKQDLAVAENYIAFPGNKLFKLPCRLLVQRNDGTFAAVEEQANTVNKNYAITPLTSDFNQDGYPDIVYSNLDGPLRIFLSDGGTAKYMKVRFPEQSKYIGAIAQVKITPLTLTDVYVLGEGLGSDNTNVLTFGVQQDTVEQVTITYLNGVKEVFQNIPANTTLVAGTNLESSFDEEKGL